MNTPDMHDPETTNPRIPTYRQRSRRWAWLAAALMVLPIALLVFAWPAKGDGKSDAAPRLYSCVVNDGGPAMEVVWSHGPDGSLFLTGVEVTVLLDTDVVPWLTVTYAPEVAPQGGPMVSVGGRVYVAEAYGSVPVIRELTTVVLGEPRYGQARYEDATPDGRCSEPAPEPEPTPTLEPTPTQPSPAADVPATTRYHATSSTTPQDGF